MCELNLRTNRCVKLCVKLCVNKPKLMDGPIDASSKTSCAIKPKYFLVFHKLIFLLGQKMALISSKLICLNIKTLSYTCNKILTVYLCLEAHSVHNLQQLVPHSLVMLELCITGVYWRPIYGLQDPATPTR